MSGRTIFGGFNNYIEEFSSSGGSIYAGLAGGKDAMKEPKGLVLGLGVVAAIVVAINIYVYSQLPAESSGGSQSRRRNRRSNRS